MKNTLTEKSGLYEGKENMEMVMSRKIILRFLGVALMIVSMTIVAYAQSQISEGYIQKTSGTVLGSYTINNDPGNPNGWTARIYSTDGKCVTVVSPQYVASNGWLYSKYSTYEWKNDPTKPELVRGGWMITDPGGSSKGYLTQTFKVSNGNIIDIKNKGWSAVDWISTGSGTAGTGNNQGNGGGGSNGSGGGGYNGSGNSGNGSGNNGNSGSPGGNSSGGRSNGSGSGNNNSPCPYCPALLGVHEGWCPNNR